MGDNFDDIPTLTVFAPQQGRANGSSVVIAPGGAYLGLAINLEGRQVADWYAARGFTAFVLKYRLGAKYLMPVPLTDASRAMRLVRSLAPKFKLDPERIGIMGFSAGGHLAALLSTRVDNGHAESGDPVEHFSNKPDFVVLGYPWLNAMQPSPPPPFIASYQNLMKIPEAGRAAFEAYTPIRGVSADVAPTFIFITTDDATVSVQAAIDYFGALKSAGVPAEFHCFAHGTHGIGLGSGDPALDLWPVLLESWLRGRHVLP
ncbi:MAG TPA: alpha/beta hydrolase [Opitutaceae bacterium]|nr:alpha/beta hydrolase [Opitutaceae bacterium]